MRYRFGLVVGVLLAIGAGARAENAEAARAAYEKGCAAFGEKDYAGAVRSLSALAPFDQGEMALHARYLLARVRHLSGERPEAAAGYEAVVKGWGGKSPAPEFVARALFYWGMVLSEFGRAEEAFGKFVAAVEAGPSSPIAPEARLRAARAGVQVKRYAEVLRIVEPLREDAKFGAEALRYVAKAQYGIGATPVPQGRGVAAVMNAAPDPRAMAAGVKSAIETLRKVQAKDGAERGMVLLDLGDFLQLDRQYKEAAERYGEAMKIGGVEIAERAMARRAIALELAGEFGASEEVCRAFLKDHPASALCGEMLVRMGENAMLSARASGGSYEQAAVIFAAAIKQYPQTMQADLARMDLAIIDYVQGRFDKAAAMLEKIPESDRVDDLIAVSFLLADCQLRSVPESAEDALTSARAAQQLEQVIAQLDNFMWNRPGSLQTPDALMRIANASQRLSNLLADPTEKRRAQSKGRRAYMRVMAEFGEHPLYPVALLEYAKVVMSGKGEGAAVMELGRFGSEPLNRTSLAPVAMITLAEAQRARRRPEEAIRILNSMAKSGVREAWRPAVGYCLGLAYKEAGKLAEARETFAKVAGEFPKTIYGAEAPWRIAQCKTDPALAAVEIQRRIVSSNRKPAVQAAALANLMESTQKLREAVKEMGDAATALAAKGDESGVAQKMNYDAAWCWKSVGEVEAEVARRNGAGGAMALLPGEEKAREKFKAVIEGGDGELADASRVELAEMMVARNELDPAIELLKSAAEGAANPDVGIRLKVWAASLFLSKGDAKAAGDLAQEVLMAEGAKERVNPYAQVVAVEVAWREKDWKGTVEKAQMFMEGAKGVSRLPGVSDHALFRLADAQARLGQVKEAKGTISEILSRFPKSEVGNAAKALLGRIEAPEKNPAEAVVAADAGAAGLSPRIPNMMPLNARKSISPVLNPLMGPAPPVNLPVVGNLEGGPALPPLVPAAREMQVEIAPALGPLAFDVAPYVQSAAAMDDAGIGGGKR